MIILPAGSHKGGKKTNKLLFLLISLLVSDPVAPAA